MAQFSRFSTYIAPLVNTPKTQAYTMVILSLFAVIFFGIFAIKPTIVTIVSLQKQLSDANAADQKLAAKIQQLQQAQTSLDAVAPQTSLLTQALPDSPNVSSILLMLETQAANSKVGLGGVQFHAVSLTGEEANAVTASQSATLSAQPQTQPVNSIAAAPKINTIDFSFMITGSYTQISDFLHHLVLPRRMLVIDNIVMVNKDGAMSATITAKGFSASSGSQ